MTDQELIALLKQENRHKALVRLYKYERTVRSFIIKNSGTKAEAQDIFQEALIVLCKKVNNEDFQLTSSLDTYLFSVCKGLWQNELRKKNRVTTIVHGDVPDETYATGDDSKYKLASTALTSITEACKQLLNLFYIKQQSMAEIAMALGYSGENSAKNRKYKCLEKARGAYQELLNQSNSTKA